MEIGHSNKVRQPLRWTKHEFVMLFMPKFSIFKLTKSAKERETNYRIESEIEEFCSKQNNHFQLRGSRVTLTRKLFTPAV